MGGGDLNSKKSWHPNTMKNQERVWKAEQAAAEEKKRISELQRERMEEKERAELNEMAKLAAGSSTENRLNWMYDKPDKKAQDEDYLLGKAIEKKNTTEEENAIPAVSRRVVGCSMLASGGDTQVDLARKIREDPLLLVKERERAARAALLNNPLHRKRLADLLRKEQEQKKEKTKKKSKNKDLDNMLAAKLSVLSAEKGVDLAKLLASDDSSSESDDSSDQKRHKKKKKHKKSSKKTKSEKKSKYPSDSEEESNSKKNKVDKHKSINKNRHDNKMESRKNRHNSDSSDHETKSKKSKRKYESKYDEFDLSAGNQQHSRNESHTQEESRHKNREDRTKYQSGSGNRRQDSSHDKYRERQRSPDFRRGNEKPSRGMSDDEKARKLSAMMAAGAEREVERKRRVEAQQRADAAAETAPRVRAGAARNEARALPDSLEKRIQSNRHNIQRDRLHMNQHFARR